MEIKQELITTIADSLMDVLDQDLCLAFWIAGTKEVFIRCSQPLFQDDIEKIKASISNASASFDNHRVKGAELRASINGRSEEWYPKGESISPLKSFLNIPLSIGTRLIGIISIASFREKTFGQREILLLQRVATQAPEALRILWTLVNAERNRFQAVVNNLIDGLLLVDEGNKVLLINPPAFQILGLEDEEIKTLSDLKKAKRLDVVDFLTSAISRRREVLNKIIKIEKSNTIIGVRINLVKDKSGRVVGWMVLLRDITANWSLDKIQSEILSVVSHQLHVPLASIKEGVNLVLEGVVGKLNREQQRCLTIVKEDVHYLQQLLDNLLNLSQLDLKEAKLDRRKKVDINILVTKVLESFKFQAKRKGITLKKSLPSPAPKLKADRDKISQVLINLIDNGIKFTPRRGQVHVVVKDKGKEVEISVEDTGIGIPEGDMERIFQRFQRLDNPLTKKVRGYGLGLSIAKEIVQSYGGKIWVKSQVGKGSKFIFVLPKG